MYIAIYVTTIALICAGAITFFIVKDQKNKKLAEKLQKQAEEERMFVLGDNQIGGVAGGSFEAKNESLGAQTEDTFAQNNLGGLPQQQAGLEDFSLPFEKEKKPKQSFDLNPFSLDGASAKNSDKKDENDFENFNLDEENFDKDEEEKNENDGDLDKKFKEYEEFLRRNLDFDDEDFEDDDFLKDAKFEGNENENGFAPTPIFNHPQRLSDADDLSALQNFDYDSLKGKSEEEISEIVKNLPPKAQEILMSDILARRKFDDEE